MRNNKVQINKNVIKTINRHSSK